MNANYELTIRVLGAIVIILTATSVCGRLALMIHQPRVVGEMVAGILLGPSLLGMLSPGAVEFLFPANVKSVLYVVSMIGLTFYMFLVGAAIDHGAVTRVAVRRAGLLAVSGIVPSFILGAGLAYVLYDRFATGQVGRGLFILFLGGALSITAFPMLARIMEERRMTKTELGTLSLVAAAVDDAFAWILLAIIAALAADGGAEHALKALLGTIAFGLVMLTAGRWLLRKIGDRLDRAGQMDHETLIATMLIVLLAGWFTEYIGVFSVFGGFLAGLALPDNTFFREHLRVRLMDFNAVFLLPLFFTFSGLNTDMASIWGSSPIPLILIVLGAVIGKYGGCTLAARWTGMGWRQASAIGSLMNARGLMILVFINLGLASKVISQDLFSILVVVAVLTTAVAMPLYNWSLPQSHEEELLPVPETVDDLDLPLTPLPAAQAGHDH